MTKTFKTFDEAVDFYEDREISEDATFFVKGCVDQLQLLDTAYDVAGTAFTALTDRIEESGGKIHYCCEWHNGYDDKSGFVIFSHDDLSFANKIAESLPGRVGQWFPLAG
jgi:hypothetical protein